MLRDVQRIETFAAGKLVASPGLTMLRDMQWNETLIWASSVSIMVSDDAP